MKKEDFISLANAYGWESVVSKNHVMISFTRNAWRMNIYFTTGTITFQDKTGEAKNFRFVDTEERFETILMNQA